MCLSGAIRILDYCWVKCVICGHVCFSMFYCDTEHVCFIYVCVLSVETLELCWMRCVVGLLLWGCCCRCRCGRDWSTYLIVVLVLIWLVDCSSDSSVRLTNVDALTASKYEEELKGLLSSAKPLDTSNVADCLSGTGLGFYIPDATRFVFRAFTPLRQQSPAW